MDSGEWTRTVIAFVLGALSPVLVEFARAWIERRQRWQDRREDFQKATLIELQEAIDRLATHTRALFLELRHGREPSEELQEAQRQAEARVIVLKVRADDEQTRNWVQDYLEASRTVFTPGDTNAERERALNQSMRPFNAANERIGE